MKREAWSVKRKKNTSFAILLTLFMLLIKDYHRFMCNTSCSWRLLSEWPLQKWGHRTLARGFALVVSPVCVVSFWLFCLFRSFLFGCFCGFARFAGVARLFRVLVHDICIVANCSSFQLCFTRGKYRGKRSELIRSSSEIILKEIVRLILD